MISLNMKIASIFLTLLLPGIFIAGCSPPASITNETAHAVSLSPSSTMATSLIPAETETPAVTNTPSATLTPAIPTFTISPTCTQSLPTPTRLPTLQAEEAEIRILELLRNNGGCDFPCWWGIIPGETSLHTARSFLETFDMIVIGTIFDESGGYARWFVTEDDLIIAIDVDMVTDREPVATVEGMWVVVQVTRRLDEGGFEVVWENPLNEQYLQLYMLPQILSTYGQPDDVLIQVNEGWRVFDLLLDYSSRGFSLWYTADLEQNGDIYRGCMANAYTHISLWDPDLAYTWAEGITRTTSGEAWEIDALREVFQPLEEATSLTLDEFYQIFSNPENTSCLETPVEIWPGP